MFNEIKDDNKITGYAFGPAIFSLENSYLDIMMMLSEISVINKIISGEIRGLSPEVKINKWICTICNEDYEYCEHEIHKTYDNKVCSSQPTNIEFLAGSIVSKPLDEKCRIEDLLVVYREQNKKNIWFGFNPNAINNRFKHLQKAFDSRLITSGALHLLSKRFSIKLIDVVEFSAH